MSQAQQPSRMHPVHGVVETTHGPTIVFVTVCTRDRHPWLANDAIHTLLREVWLAASAWRVGRYILMPNHIHFFAGYTGSPIALDPWIRYWKSQFSKRHQVTAHRWQTDAWDTRMRSAAQYEEKWDYVRFNAVRKGLVTRPEDWPYQGVIFDLPW